MKMSDELKVFEDKSLIIAKNLKALKNEKEKIEKEEKNLKKTLEDLFNEYGLKSFKNDYFTISKVEASESKSIDLKFMEKKEPELYEELLEDYPKISKRKSYIRISVK